VPVSGTSSIIDVGGVGLSRFWGLRSHLQVRLCVRSDPADHPLTALSCARQQVASQVASANFPETIDRVFVVGAPSFFPTVFNWAKKWCVPRRREQDLVRRC
jgi:hypothetical protein